MRRHLIVAALVVGVTPALQAQWASRYSEVRTAQLDARNVRVVRIEARAGGLRVVGRSGVSEVRVRGTARASAERWLQDLQIVAERRGDEVRIVAVIPELDWRRSLGNVERALDLIIEIPAGLAVDVTDTSGDVDVSGAGDVDIEDGSGNVRIESVAGDVRVRDGSGDVEVRDVAGHVTVLSDGSGNLSLYDVRRSVLVEEDGSGDITVRRVGGSFTVRRDGSGGITTSSVEGTISVPSRYSRSGRRYSMIRMD